MQKHPQGDAYTWLPTHPPPLKSFAANRVNEWGVGCWPGYDPPCCACCAEISTSPALIMCGMMPGVGGACSKGVQGGAMLGRGGRRRRHEDKCSTPPPPTASPAPQCSTPHPALPHVTVCNNACLARGTSAKASWWVVGWMAGTPRMPTAAQSGWERVVGGPIQACAFRHSRPCHTCTLHYLHAFPGDGH